MGRLRAKAGVHGLGRVGDRRRGGGTPDPRARPWPGLLHAMSPPGKAPVAVGGGLVPRELLDELCGLRVVGVRGMHLRARRAEAMPRAVCSPAQDVVMRLLLELPQAAGQAAKAALSNALQGLRAKWRQGGASGVGGAVPRSAPPPAP